MIENESNRFIGLLIVYVLTFAVPNLATAANFPIVNAPASRELWHSIEVIDVDDDGLVVLDLYKLMSGSERQRTGRFTYGRLGKAETKNEEIDVVGHRLDEHLYGQIELVYFDHLHNALISKMVFKDGLLTSRSMNRNKYEGLSYPLPQDLERKDIVGVSFSSTLTISAIAMLNHELWAYHLTPILSDRASSEVIKERFTSLDLARDEKVVQINMPSSESIFLQALSLDPNGWLNIHSAYKFDNFNLDSKALAQKRPLLQLSQTDLNRVIGFDMRGKTNSVLEYSVYVYIKKEEGVIEEIHITSRELIRSTYASNPCAGILSK